MNPKSRPAASSPPASPRITTARRQPAGIHKIAGHDRLQPPYPFSGLPEERCYVLSGN